MGNRLLEVGEQQMGKKLAIAMFGLAALCTSQVLAGTLGNGAAQRRAAAGLPPEEAKTQYAFCYGGNVKVVYFNRIITLAPTTSAPNLAVAYGDYVKATYGLPGVDRLRCVTANSNADAAAEKGRYRGRFGRTKIVEIEWAGDSTSVR
jgi:hypothetical protein